MKVWIFTRLWTYENEFPRVEQYAFDSEDKAIEKANEVLADDKETDPDFWKKEFLIVKGSLNEHHLEAYIDGEINTTYMSWSISELEIN